MMRKLHVFGLVVTEQNSREPSNFVTKSLADNQMAPSKVDLASVQSS